MNAVCRNRKLQDVANLVTSFPPQQESPIWRGVSELSLDLKNIALFFLLLEKYVLESFINKKGFAISKKGMFLFIQVCAIQKHVLFFNLKSLYFKERLYKLGSIFYESSNTLALQNVFPISPGIYFYLVRIHPTYYVVQTCHVYKSLSKY